eukprot:Skav215771  [mRNA]  locus=scaffold380:20490:25818:+ [translate_table: standard]
MMLTRYVPLPRLLVSVCGIPPEDSVTCCFPFARAPKAVKPIKAVPSVHVVGYLDDDKAGSLALAQETKSREEPGEADCRPLATAMEKAAVWQDTGGSRRAAPRSMVGDWTPSSPVMVDLLLPKGKVEVDPSDMVAGLDEALEMFVGILGAEMCREFEIVHLIRPARGWISA